MLVYRCELVGVDVFETNVESEVAGVGLFYLDDLPKGTGGLIWEPFVEFL